MHAFETRVRARRGLPPPPALTGEPWREGDALAFVPQLNEPVAARRAPRHGLQAVVWLAVAVAAF
jgi:hypothetical protein